MNKKTSTVLLLAGLSLACVSVASAEGAAPAKAGVSAESLMKKSDCFACHSVKKKIVGPAYADVAKKYKGDKEAVAKLTKKVKEGGSGNWGAVPMAAHPAISDADLKAMVEWVLKQKK